MSDGWDDTIAALASAPGSAGRGILRISGVDAISCVQPLFVPDEPNRRVDSLRRPQRTAGQFAWKSSIVIPAALYVWPTARSYTGQPMVELHTIGSPPILEASLGAVFDRGVRPARPGEFTLRAFLAGRVDLIQAEAVLGVIDAHDHVELETALQQLAGGLSGRIAAVRSDLLDLLADLEAGLDFVEEDIKFIERDSLLNRLASAATLLESLNQQADERMLSRDRLRIVLAGLPNAGKSTLFNALSGQDAALVSELAGTTRDYLNAAIDCCGVPCELIDTAGWEESAQQIMRQAQLFRSEQFQKADLVVWCTPADLSPDMQAAEIECFDTLTAQNKAVLHIDTKADMDGALPRHGQLSVCAHTGRGLAELQSEIARRLTDRHSGQRQLLGSTASRCRESLTRSSQTLRRAIEATHAGMGDEIIAIELRESLEHLGRILGSVFTDDILDRIFSKFCIGK